MDDKEIEALLKGSVGSTNLTTSERMQSLQATRLGLPMTGPASGKGFIERNIRDLPLDTETGVEGLRGAWIKFQTALREEPEQKLQYLQEVYGKDMARMSDTGEPLVKVIDEKTGKGKEVKINEESFTATDLGTLAAYIPEAVGEALAIFAARGKRAPKFLQRIPTARDITAGSIGQELGQEAKEVTMETIDSPRGVVPAVGEVFQKRLGVGQLAESGTDIGLNAAMGLGMVAAGRSLGRAISPFASANPSEVALRTQAGAKFLKDVHGIDYPLTPAERTGSKLLGRLEAALSKQPGSSATFQRFTDEKIAALNRFQNRLLGVPDEATPMQRAAAIPSEEIVGRRATEALRKRMAPVQAGVKEATKEFETVASRQIQTELEPELFPERAGGLIRSKALAERSAFQTESKRLYDEWRKLPGGTDRIFDNAGLVRDAERILKRLPPVEKTTTVPTGVLSPTGQPITRTITGTEISKEFVPSDVVPRLREITDNPTTKRSLEDLKQMRNDVDNSIAQGEAIPGVQTGYLKSIRNAITDEMDRAANSMPGGQLKTAFQAANTYYKNNVGKFEQGTIARLFKDIESRGFVQDEDIVRNIGPTEYNSFKQFLGPASPEFKSLQAAIRGEIYKSAILPGTDYGPQLIDGRQLIQTLSSFYRKNTSFADEVLGGKGMKLQRLGEAISAIASQKGAKTAKIDLQEFEDVLRSNKPIVPAVQKLLKKQDELDRLYRSKLLKDIGDGKLGDTDFDAAEFVNRFYDIASPKELQLVVSQLSDRQDILESVRQKVKERILYEAQRAAKATDPVTLGRGEVFRPASTAALEKAFGDATQRQKLMEILGPRDYRAFEQLANILRSGEVTEQAFLAAGGWSAGTQVANIFRNGPWSGLTDFAKQKLWALMFSKQPIKGWLSNTARTKAPSWTTARNLLFFQPFVEAVIDEFGAKEGENVLNQMADGIARQPTNAPASSADARAQQILNAR